MFSCWISEEFHTFTFFTNDIFLKAELPCGAIVNFLKCNLKLVDHILSFMTEKTGKCKLSSKGQKNPKTTN